MALSSNYVQIYGQLPEVFARISDGQAPEKFTRQHLKDLGFTSPTFHAVIPLLKNLGFLSNDGSPTERYHAYRDRSQSKIVMGQALREAYSDLFTIKAEPTTGDRALIEGKFKSFHNASEQIAKLMSNTFFALLALADIKAGTSKPTIDAKVEKVATVEPPSESKSPTHTVTHRPTLHYNIQIHLPATKDLEVFNAIFKSLREHLLD